MACTLKSSDKTCTNNSFVEMRYNPNATNGMIWEPLRIRSDKSEPQYFKVANNVWKTIMNPITDNMIIGKEEFKYIPTDQDKDLYYLDNYDKNRDYPFISNGTARLSVHLRFGNLSIRSLVRASLNSANSGAKIWLSELIWRDFYQMI